MQIFSTAFLPPVSWFSMLKAENMEAFQGRGRGQMTIEAWENFQKQTVRNRAYIASPNGRQALTVPIDKGNFSELGKCLTKDVRISDHSDWRHQHLQALETAYYNSPFFEYLYDDFRAVYSQHWERLVDFNEAMLRLCFSIIDVEMDINYTDEYQGVSVCCFDKSSSFENKSQAQREYYQVFAEKHGFLKDLSIVDLIFNTGKEAVLFL